MLTIINVLFLQTILNVTNMAKFHKGQEVWGRPLFGCYGSSYIPSPYTVTSVTEGNDGALYHVRGTREAFKEEELRETEPEALLMCTERFRNNTFRQIGELASRSRRLGCADRVKDEIFRGDQLFLGAPEIKTERGYILEKPTPKYEVGQTVFGHLYDEYQLLPVERFVISAVHVTKFGQLRDIPAHWEVLYNVKGHGKREVEEGWLFPAEEDALLHDLERYRVAFKSSAYCIQTHAQRLGIEGTVQQVLQTPGTNPLLEFNK